MTDKKILIEAKNISKTYRTVVDEVKVFDEVNVTIEAGSAVAIIGGSGRGKTTLLNILSGLDNPTTGEVFFDGNRIDMLTEAELADFRNRNVGFIFQHHFLLDDFTALDNILVPLRISGKRIDAETMARAEQLLESVGLKDRKTHYPDQLSGGERQRVAVLRALIHDPQVIFADEPTGSLDRKNAANVEEVMWELKNKYNKTLVISTHSMDIAKKCDRIIEL